MATPRLPFLWPVLFRPLKPSASHSRVARRHVKPIRSFVTSARRTQESATQRYGTALEPAPHLREQQVQKEKDEQPKKSTVKESQESVEEEEEEEEIPKTATPSMPKTSSIDATDTVTPAPPPDPPRMTEQKPLDTVLHMPSPTEEDEHKPPHLKTPPYVHHFDTYSLVKQLAKGGFSSEQSVSIMKAVRGILTDNMELAREGLVSKSNVENETYLFRAACSELRTEVGHSRLGEKEKMRSERNQLQHEVDILSQRVGQETTQLKDELKGLFDDRKMSVRQEQRYMESKIQELNYKITVALNSDARSEVEGLRWVLTRRAAITVAASAFMLIAALRYSSYLSHIQQEEKKKANERRPPPEAGDSLSPATNSPVSDHALLEGELLATRGGVSLG